MRSVVLGALLLTPLSAQAQQPAGPEPFPAEGAPAGGLALPDIGLGGYFQPGFAFVKDTPFDQQDRDGFVFFNARITGQSDQQIHDDVMLGLRFNFDVGGGAFAVRDVYGTVDLLDGLLNIGVGQLKVPFMLAERTSESQLQFPVNTPLRTRTRQLRGAGLSQGRDRGVRVRSEGMAGSVWIAGEMGVFNGEGQNALQNSDDEYLYSGRIEVGPMGKLDYAEPDLARSDFKFALGISASMTPSIASRSQGVGDTGAEDQRIAVDMRLRAAGFSLRAEYVQSKQTSDDSDQNVDRYGVYAQAGYVLPLDLPIKIEPAVRFSQYDNHDGEDGVSQIATAGGTEARYDVSDNSETRMIDFGLNTYIKDHALKLMLMYRLTDFLEGPQTDLGWRELTRTGALGGQAGEGEVLIGDSFYAMLQFAWL